MCSDSPKAIKSKLLILSGGPAAGVANGPWGCCYFSRTLGCDFGNWNSCRTKRTLILLTLLLCHHVLPPGFVFFILRSSLFPPQICLIFRPRNQTIKSVNDKEGVFLLKLLEIFLAFCGTQNFTKPFYRKFPTTFLKMIFQSYKGAYYGRT